MYRRFIGFMFGVGAAALLFALNLRLPFLKTYFRLCLIASGLLLAQQAQAQSWGGGCTTGTCTTSCNTCTPGCQHFHCPPALKWCAEGMPRICFKHGCPKPICNPCEAPGLGYYQKCWTPWPWAPDWSHCPVQPPASQVIPGLTPAGAPAAMPVSIPVGRMDARPY